MGKKDKNSADEAALFAIGSFVVMVVGGVAAAIAVVPKEVWVGLGILVVVGLMLGLFVWTNGELGKARAATVQREAPAFTLWGKGEKDRQRRRELIGPRYAERFNVALKAVEQISKTEAARDGWLGEIDFSADLRCTFDDLQRAIALRRTAKKLSDLAEPSESDLKILKDAKAAASRIDRIAFNRIDLIKKCAREARRIDESLEKERESARTAEQRAQLNGQLYGMLYGIEKAPNVPPADSGAERVMSWVAAYREIENLLREGPI